MIALRVLSPIRHREFRALFSGNVVSNLGDWLDLVALLVLVSVVWHRGATGLAVVSVAATLPVLVAPLIGVLVDRSSPRTVMIAADLIRAALTLGLVFAGDLWQVAAIVLVRAALGTGFNASAQVLIRHSVPGEELVAANSLSQAVAQSVKIIGPAVGGGLVAALSPQTVFGVNAVSFLVSAFALSFLRVGKAAAPTAGRRSYLRELAEGLTYVTRSRTLAVTAVTMSLLMFVVFLYDSMAPLAVLGLGLDSSFIGYMLATVGGGGLLGALVLGQLFRGHRPFLVMGPAVLVIGVAVAAVGIGVLTEVRWGPVPWMAMTFLLGVASAGILVPYPVIVQTVTPEHLIGRTWATMSALTGVLNVAAPTLGAALVGWRGVGTVFLGAGLVLAVYGTAVALVSGHVTVGADPEDQAPEDAAAQTPAQLGLVPSEAEIQA